MSPERSLWPLERDCGMSGNSGAGVRTNYPGVLGSAVRSLVNWKPARRRIPARTSCAASPVCCMSVWIIYLMCGLTLGAQRQCRAAWLAHCLCHHSPYEGESHGYCSTSHGERHVPGSSHPLCTLPRRVVDAQTWLAAPREQNNPLRQVALAPKGGRPPWRSIMSMCTS
jgi:hypothetical protein